MYYKVEVKDHIRVPPDMFEMDIEEAIAKRLKKKYEAHISQDLGIVISCTRVKEIGQGKIIPGDGAAYYNVLFELLTFKPILHEVILGKISDITDFGAFIAMGPIEGMIHISQSMDDYVSFSKNKTLVGKETKKSIKVGDLCLTKIIAVSFKDLQNPKIGLTMRQAGLGKIETK